MKEVTIQSVNGYPYFGKLRNSEIVVLFVSEKSGILVEDPKNDFGTSDGKNEWIGSYYHIWKEDHFEKIDNYSIQINSERK